MPTDDRVRLHDDQGGPPISPRVGEQDPEESVTVAEWGTLGGTPEHRQLLTKREVLKRDSSVSAAEQREGTEQDDKRRQHGLSCRAVDQESNGVAGDLVLAKDRHRSQGDDVVVVSGSLDVYLGPWCETRGMDYICSTLEVRGGRLTGRYVQGDCSGAEKVRRILQRYKLARYALVYAYGDSGEDREMLELAHKKYYRWREISSWDDVASFGHPSASRSDRAKESNAG